MNRGKFQRRAVESLETRRLLAASVAFEDGDLEIVGTEGDDEIIISSTGTGGLVINGTVFPYVGTLNNLLIDGLGGNDRIFLTDVNVADSVDVEAGDGNDDVRFSRVTAAEDVNLDTGAGNDSLRIEDVVAGDDAEFRTGADNDFMQVVRTRAEDQVRIDASGGDDVAIVGFFTARRILLFGGTGNDAIAINPNTIEGKLTLRQWERVAPPFST